MTVPRACRGAGRKHPSLGIGPFGLVSGARNGEREDPGRGCKPSESSDVREAVFAVERGAHGYPVFPACRVKSAAVAGGTRRDSLPVNFPLEYTEVEVALSDTEREQLRRLKFTRDQPDDEILREAVMRWIFRNRTRRGKLKASSGTK